MTVEELNALPVESETAKTVENAVNAAEASEQGAASAPPAKKADEAEELRASLHDANVKIELLMAGIAKEHIDEGARLAAVMCAAGDEPSQAAAKVAEEYPHLKTVKRELPRFMAMSGGSGADGFECIRRVFARK